MKILVIGGTRFIGKFLVRDLLLKGFEVTLITRGLTGKIPTGVQSIQLDRDTPEFFHTLKNLQFDVVVDTCLYSFSQAEILANLLRMGLTKKIVFISSIAVFGLENHWPLPLKAQDPQLPGGSDYAAHKIRAQSILEGTANDLGLSCWTAFLPQVFGPDDYQLREMIPYKLIKNDLPLLLEAAGQYLIPNGYVENVSSALTAIVQSKLAGLGAVLVAGEGYLTQRDLIQNIGNFLSMEPQIYELPRKVLHGLIETKQIKWEWPFPSKHLVLDLEPLQSQFAFKTPFTIQEGLEKTLQWYQEKKIKDPFLTSTWDLSVISQYYRDFKLFEIPQTGIVE